MFTGENILMAMDKDRDRFDEIDEKQRLQNLLDKQVHANDMIKNNDLVPLVGEIKIQIQKLTDIKIVLGEFSSYFILIRLAGSTKNWIEKEIYGKGLEDFKYAMRLTVMNVLEENLSTNLVIKLIGINKLNVRQELGSVEIPWKKCLEIPNEWVINNTYKLLADNQKTSPCEMKMQIKWITFGNAEFKATVYDDYYLKKGFTAPKTEEGYLEVVLRSAFLNNVGESTTLKIVTPDGKNYTLSPETRMDKEHVFNQKYLCEMKFLKDDLLSSIFVSCKNGKEALGDAYINWSEAIYFTRDYSENKACLLYKDKQKTSHKVYLKFRFLTKIQARQLELDEKSKQPKELSTYLKGVLKVGIVRAKNLVGEEKGDDGKMKSDPFVQLRFKNDDKPIKFTTDVVESSLNPIWNDHFSFNLKILKEGTPPPLELEVFDHDTWSANDLIATGFVRVDDCIRKPGEWAVNGWFPLKPNQGSKGAAGEIYIRANFILEGEFDKNTNPIDIDTKQEYVIKYNTAKLYFRIIAGRSLLYLVDGVPQPSVSAYCEAVFPKDKTKETKYVTDTKDPNWNYSYAGSFDVPEDLKKMPEVLIKIKQKTGMLSKDVVLSSVSVNLQKCFDKRGVWAINELIPIPGEEKLLRPLSLKNMGELYIQSKIVEGGRIDDEVEPELKITLPKANEGEIRGTLLINVVHCRDLPIMDSGVEGNLCDPLVHFTTPGGSEVETPVISNNLNPIFNRKLIMFYKVSKADDVKPLKVSVFDSDRFSGRDLVGVVNVDIMPCITNPNKWMINKIFDIQEVPADKKIKGETPQVYFQLKFLSEGEIDDGSEAGLLEDLSKIVSNRSRNGTVIFRVIHAKGLIRGDSGMTGSASDPYVILELPPADTKYKTKVIGNTLVPFWNETFKHALEISDIRYVKKAKIAVWDSDSIVAGGDDLLGNAELDLAPIFQTRNEWAINKLIELDGPESLKKSLRVKNFGSLYVQCLYHDKGTEANKTPAALIEDIEKLKLNSEISGTLLLKVIHAKNIMAGDSTTSDPFVRINWPGGNKSDTKVRDGTLTPVWNELMSQKINLNKLVNFVSLKNIPMVQLEIYDWDRLSNDILGTVSLDIDQCVLSPGQWKINQNFKIEGVKEFIEKKFTYFGEIYIQAMFLEGNVAHDGKFPEVTENLKEVISRTAIKGKLELKLIHGEKLKVGDDNGKSDPFVVFTMPDKKEVESRRIDNSLNPIWNQLIVHPLNIISSYVEPIQVKVWDYDFGSRNDFLGKTQVEIDELIRNPGKWLLNKVYYLEDEIKDPKNEPSKAEGKNGSIYLQGRFVADGVTDNTAPPALLKDLAAEINNRAIKGTLAVHIIHCKDLVAENPETVKNYVAISADNGKKFEETKVVVSTNPLFKQTLLFQLNLESIDFLKPLIAKVYQKGMLSSTLCAEVSIDVTEAVKAKNTWAINKIFKFSGPPHLAKMFPNKLGEIYLQVKLLEEGKKETGELAPLVEDLTLTLKSNRLHGKLIVYVLNAFEMIPEDGDSVDPLVEIMFDNKKKRTQAKKKSINAEYKEKLIFDVDFNGISNVPLLNLNAWDEDMLRNDLIGQKVIDLKTCFEHPDTYAYNEIVPLEGPKDLLGKYRTFGSIYLQAKFLRAESQDTDNFAPLKTTLKDHLEKNRLKGKILVNCVHAKYLLKDPKAPDAMLRLVFPNKEKKDTSYKASNAFPEWKEIVTSDINLPRVEAGFLDVIVFDRGTFSNTEIGQLTIDIAPCFDKPNEWVLNRVFPVKPPKSKEKELKEGDCGTVYLQVKYLPEGVTGSEAAGEMKDTTPGEDRRKEGMYGKLFVNVKSARNVADEDGWGKGVSDPFTRVILPDAQKKDTKFIKDNLNPTWNELLIFDVKIDRNELKPIQIEVRDDDTGGSDLCGTVAIPIDELKAKSNTWAINQIYPIQYKGKTQGTIYLQIKFKEEGQPENDSKPQELDHK